MKSMKSLSMNKMLGKIQRRATGDPSSAGSAPAVQTDGAPEEVVVRCIRQFCESGGSNNTGDEVTLLPPIVDAAESSPAAAAEAARILRKFMSKDYNHKPSRQYNAIMLIRILTDNPGPTFTRNIDKKFIDTAKELLRSGRDPSVQQLLMETLDSFESTKAYDEGLYPLIEMWKKEKERGGRAYSQRPPPEARTLNAPPPDQSRSQNYWARSHSNRRLPDPIELASRLEEARTSAKLLHQVVANTPPHEVLSNDLIREFADRCQSASKSIALYMQADNPAPDNDTMEALIDTNEQLQASLNQHQRAILGARKALGIGQGGPSPASENGSGGGSGGILGGAGDVSGGAGLGINFNPTGGSSSKSTPPPLPDRNHGKGKGLEVEPPARAGPSGSNTPAPEEDPFKDPDEQRLGIEPFHPGFGGSGSGSGSGNGKQPARRYANDDDDDGLYDSGPVPKKDPGETMLRY